jgi:hypothetical protein
MERAWRSGDYSLLLLSAQEGRRRRGTEQARKGRNWEARWGGPSELPLTSVRYYY